MQKKFDTLIDSFLLNNIGICENFLTKSLANSLQRDCINSYQKHLFKPAGIGNEAIQQHDLEIRKDQIYWLDRLHNNSFENAFFDIIDQLVKHLNETCYTGINAYEFHYAFFAKGSFYKTHLDQFASNSSRKYSIIFYLNPNWALSDGGELRIHHKNTIQDISPLLCKCVLFKSHDISHEVLLSNAPRYSITGWLKVETAVDYSSTRLPKN